MMDRNNAGMFICVLFPTGSSITNMFCSGKKHLKNVYPGTVGHIAVWVLRRSCLILIAQLVSYGCSYLWYFLNGSYVPFNV